MERIFSVFFFPISSLILMKKKRTVTSSSPTIKKKVKSIAPTAMEYIMLFNTCEIRKEKIAEIDKVIDEKIIVNRARYEGVSNLVKGGGANNNSLFGNHLPLFQSSYIPFYNRFNSIPSPAGSIFNINTFGTPKPTQSLYSSHSSELLRSNFVDNSNMFDLNKDIFSGVTFTNGAGVPWYFIACVHYLECSFSFKKHLHNGDPLTGYTVHVPAHRPKVGHAPPFTFEESAVDAIKLMKYDHVTNWSLPFILLKLEGYNGFGYNRKGIRTPYLWSYSNHYTKGKYVKDGVYDANVVSSQLGAAVILKRMEQRALINIPRN
jgi:lysozyme family protein